MSIDIRRRAGRGNPTRRPGRWFRRSMSSSTFSGLTLRGIGPAFTSGRISTFAVDPENSQRYFVAVCPAACGRPTMTAPVGSLFDSQGPTGIGAITIDPKPIHHLGRHWRDNSHPSVPYGDGVLQERDRRADAEEVRLKTTEHIARILVDPGIPSRLCSGAGTAVEGRRRGGLYKTIDGGKTWSSTLIKVAILRRRRPDHGSARIPTSAGWDAPAPTAVFHADPRWSGERHLAIHGCGKVTRNKTTSIPTGEVGTDGSGICPLRPDVIYA